MSCMICLVGMQEFQELWAEYDDGSGSIAPEQLQALLIRTDPPLGLGRMATGRDVLKFVFNLDIPLVNGRVPFHRTVYELVRNVSETQIPEVSHAVSTVCQGIRCLGVIVALPYFKYASKQLVYVAATSTQHKSAFTEDYIHASNVQPGMRGQNA